MTNKEHVLKYGGKFSISGGEVWTMPNGHDVHFALNPKMGCRGANIAVGFHKPGKEFAPHKHPISEEILIIHSGKGECYLYDSLTFTCAQAMTYWRITPENMWKKYKEEIGGKKNVL